MAAGPHLVITVVEHPETVFAVAVIEMTTVGDVSKRVAVGWPRARETGTSQALRWKEPNYGKMTIVEAQSSPIVQQSWILEAEIIAAAAAAKNDLATERQVTAAQPAHWQHRGPKILHFRTTTAKRSNR